MRVRPDIPIVDIVYDNVEDWHRFTSPELPELHVLVQPLDYYLGLEQVRTAIEILIDAESKGLAVRPLLRLPTCECTTHNTSGPLRPRVVRFVIQPYGSDENSEEEHLRDQIRRLETLRDKAPDVDTRNVIQGMIADIQTKLALHAT